MSSKYRKSSKFVENKKMLFIKPPKNTAHKGDNMSMNTLPDNFILQGGKYKIQGVLGQGGFGITYLAQQVMLGRTVAVKEFFMRDLCNRDAVTFRVSVGATGSEALVNRFKDKFLKEARLIAGMGDRHIVRIHDIFEENGTAYYVMEHISGGSLDSLVRKGTLKEMDALRITKEIGEALGYVHSRNVLHLDVKPSNILFRPNGEAVLIDFGISKRYDEEGEETSGSPAAISKGYAPIEQYNHSLHNFSPATDVYSLGATMFKMLTGNTPPEATLLLDEDFPHCPVGVSPQIWKAVEKAMRPSRKQRFQTVAEFINAFGGVTPKRQAARITTELDEETKALDAPPEKIALRESFRKYTVNGVSFEMILVHPGKFAMGATSEMKNPWDDECPAHLVTITKPYYLGKTVVTQALWKAVMGNNPAHYNGKTFWNSIMGTEAKQNCDNKPVESVSWKDCKVFIDKLNALTGLTFRLPTEAEWEFAARGGNKSRHFQFSGSNDLNEVAWYDKNSGKNTQDVATKLPNELGLYDMSGNVYEWCEDWYGLYDASEQTDPIGPANGLYRIARGGSWRITPRRARSSHRSYDLPDRRDNSLGFRLAL